MPVDEQCEVSFFQSLEDVVVATDLSATENRPGKNTCDLLIARRQC